MNHNKKISRRLGVQTCFLAAAAILLTCVEIPDYCGKGELKLDHQFCFARKAYDLCDCGSSYNPLTQGCDIDRGTVGTKCFVDSTFFVPVGTPCGGYTLSTAAVPESGGKITNRSPEKQTYDANEKVVVTAMAEDGYEFAGWAGAPAGATLTDISATFQMVQNQPLVAMFVPKSDPGASEYKLFTTAFPDIGGTVRVNGAEAEVSTHNRDATVSVTAAPKPGYTFSGWSGANTSESHTISVKMDGNKTLVAIFTPTLHTLKVNANPPTGGTVYINGTALADGTPQNVETRVEALALPEKGYVFAGWSGIATGMNNPLIVNIANSNPTLIANFRRHEGGGNQFNPNITYGSLTDPRDNKTYRTVVIGGKTWMAENLNFGVLDGRGSWCYSGQDEPGDCAKYGRLYDWATVMALPASCNSNLCESQVGDRHKGICPSGWRMPSNQDWDDLISAVGGNPGAGPKLRSRTDWLSDDRYHIPNTDNFGFSALPGGLRTTDDAFWSYIVGGRDGDFWGAGGYGGWWSASEYDSDSARIKYTQYSYEEYDDGWSHKSDGYSARCLRDFDPCVDNPFAPGCIVNAATPTISAQPSGGTVTVGETYTLTVTASVGDDGTLSYQWHSNTSASNSGGTPISGATSSSYTVPMSAPGTRYYYVVVTNTNYSVNGNTTVMVTSNVATITVGGGDAEMLGDTLIYAGQRYFTKIMPDGRRWMAENLNYDTLDGIGSWCYIGDGEPGDCAKYGRLYDWATVMNLPASCNTNECASQVDDKHQGICPSDWRVPSDQDWNDLVSAVGDDAGTKLKSQTGWNTSSDYIPGTDQYGFSALPGGFRWSGSFHDVGYLGYWWSATESGGDNAWSRGMLWDYGNVLRYYLGKTRGFSVRCLRD